MQQRTQRQGDTEVVAHTIVSILRWAPEPITRDELSDQVHDHMTLALGYLWQRATTERRVRDALRLLLDGDSPVISAGHGYRLAARAIAAERERAAQLAERAGVRLLAKARKIRAAALTGEPKQATLPLAICGAVTKPGGIPDPRPAGYRTNHPGAGRCVYHGGAADPVQRSFEGGPGFEVAS